jgi:hypothetical protein
MTLAELITQLQADSEAGLYVESHREPQLYEDDLEEYEEPPGDGGAYERIGVGCYLKLRAPNYDGDPED